MCKAEAVLIRAACRAGINAATTAMSTPDSRRPASAYLIFAAAHAQRRADYALLTPLGTRSISQ